MNNSENAHALQAWAFSYSAAWVTPNTLGREYTKKFRAFFVRIPQVVKGTTYIIYVYDLNKLIYENI